MKLSTFSMWAIGSFCCLDIGYIILINWISICLGAYIRENPSSVIFNSTSDIQLDYIDLGIELTPSITSAEPIDVIAEVAIVCDKEWGDRFNHDRKAILEYLNNYFWNINVGFKTMPNVTVALRVTSVTVISKLSDQPFVENARNAEGIASYNRIINAFGDWMLSKADTLQKFDIAVLISSAKVEWYGGLAYLSTACHKSRAVGLWSDDGKYGEIYIGIHEIGHILGANHDSALDWCSDRGYIMANPNLKKDFFSSCSDRQISQYARSSQGACLRNIDHEGPLPIDPGFTDAFPPSMNEQCKIRAKNENAYVKEENTAVCRDTWCDVGSYSFKFKPMEHTSCLGGGRCFRYGCRGPASLLRNVGTGQCVGSNRFDFRDKPKMIRCPEYPTPLDQFAPWNDTRWNSLALPWSTTDATDFGDKCLVNDAYADDSTVSYDKCDSVGNGNGRHAWEIIDVGNSEFLLMHRVNKNCVKPLGNKLRGYKSCDKNDASFRWKFIDQK